MITIYEWKPTFQVKAICGHTIAAGQKACKLTIAVCQDDVACLPEAIKAALQAQLQAAQKPLFLYLLWQWCFGTKPKKAAIERDMPARMRQCTAKQAVRLDCGHTVKAGSPLWESRMYTCTRENRWPLAVLSACLQVLQQQQAAPQPTTVNKTPPVRNVYTYDHHQASA